MFKKVRNLIFTGILVILPLVASIYIIYFLFSVIDRWTRPLIEILIGREVPGVGIIFTFLVILFVGLFATNIIGKRIIIFGENILLRIPLFRNIYISIKKVLEAIFTRNTSSFKKPVLFEYPRKGLYQVGFLTRDSSPYFDSITGRELYNVFLPTTPNPTSGMFILIPKEEAIILDLSIEDALKLIISGGILSPESLTIIKEDDKG
ncbi:MAG: hypothetical protein PWR10_1364 [Halanaerobiales bacterium]|nr:hypothetical protein [Halanaerobiales bacterium]